VTTRRVFIGTLAGALLAAPLAASAQQAGKVYRIGVVVGGGDLTDNLRQGLRELGWVEGQNVVVLKRVWGGRTEQFPEIIADLIQLKVDIIVSSSTPAVRAAKESTRTIPIVMAGLTDPVGAGLISSLARPGGNITGLTNIFTELTAKRLELLKEVAPQVSRVAVPWNPTHPGQAIAWQQTQRAAQALGLVLFSAEVRRPEDFGPAFTAIVAERAAALLVLPDPLTTFHRQQTADFAVKQRLPSMGAASYWAEAGGLLSYGTSFPVLWRRAAVYVDKILKGAKPADLPVEQPTKFELVINLKTAKALGLTIPQSLLQRADEVISRRFAAAMRLARIEVLVLDAELLQNRAKGARWNVSGVLGDDSRAVDRRIVPDLVAAFALPLQHTPERAKFPAELSVGHAGTTSGTRVGLASGRRPAGSASPVSSITSISSRAMSGASSTTSSGLAP